jgi:hypothetical protein
MGNLIYEDTEVKFNRIIYKLELNDWEFMTSPEKNVLKFRSNIIDKFMIYKYYNFPDICKEIHIIIILNELGQVVRENSFHSIKELINYFEICMYLL